MSGKAEWVELDMVKFVRSFVLLSYASLLLMSSNLLAETEVQIETVEDLGVLKRQAENVNLPILLMFTAEDCEFCDAIRINYLQPMVKSGDYESTILIRQVYIEDYSYLRNAKGDLISGDVLAFKYNVDVTPTILFLSSTGHELAQRLIGISNIHYFGDTLDKHISMAKSALVKKNVSKIN